MVTSVLEVLPSCRFRKFGLPMVAVMVMVVERRVTMRFGGDGGEC